MENKSALPEYPFKTDIWKKLQCEKRPIVVYGMGNGTDKLLRRLERYNIEVSDFFASDGFVRGQTFHEKRVLSFSEIKEKYEDFVILVAFASRLPDVVSRIYEMKEKYELYVPDMPVVDDIYFDSDFYNANYPEIVKSYDLLNDNTSKELFSSVVWYKLTADIDYLKNTSTQCECYSLLSSDKYKYVFDAGAYNGDTAKEFISYFPNLRKIYAVEPDPKNCAKLKKFATSAPCDIEVIEAALGDKAGYAEFSSSKNRNSSITNMSYQHKTVSVEIKTVDDIVKEGVDYIKYDVEGAEREALLGSFNTIMRDAPDLLVSLYHRSEDVFSLINYVADNFKGYKLYLRRLFCLPAWELNLYAIKEHND